MVFNFKKKTYLRYPDPNLAKIPYLDLFGSTSLFFLTIPVLVWIKGISVKNLSTIQI